MLTTFQFTGQFSLHFVLKNEFDNNLTLVLILVYITADRVHL